MGILQGPRLGCGTRGGVAAAAAPPIQSSDVAPPGPRLTTLSYTQALFDEQLSLRVGRLSIDSLYGEEFAGSTYFRQFTSVAS